LLLAKYNLTSFR